MPDGMIYVYRFQDLAALSSVEAIGDTIYMSAYQARQVKVCEPSKQ